MNRQTLKTTAAALLMASGLSLAALSLNAGCSQTCNHAYYFPGAHLSLQRPNTEPLADGTYDVRITVEGASLEFSLEKQGDKLICDAEEGCYFTEPLGDEVEVMFMASETELSMYVRNVSSGGGPARIQLEVWHDGVAVFDQEVVPAYSNDEPNGKGCGITRRASHVLVLD